MTAMEFINWSGCGPPDVRIVVSVGVAIIALVVMYMLWSKQPCVVA